jgi:MarR family transcriptional regulator, lower aerobic nicotinate degradation pathway regulator
MPLATKSSAPLETFSRMPGHLIRRVYQVSTALFADACRDVDLTPVQYAALVAIQSHPRVDATRLSQLIYFDRSTIGDVLDRLEAKGWIVRHPSPDDRRIKCVTLSPAGRGILRQVEAGIRRVQDRLLAPLSPKDADTLVRLLARLADAHDDVRPW